jgi:hypothetical protein
VRVGFGFVVADGRDVGLGVGRGVAFGFGLGGGEGVGSAAGGAVAPTTTTFDGPAPASVAPRTPAPDPLVTVKAYGHDPTGRVIRVDRVTPALKSVPVVDNAKLPTPLTRTIADVG